MFSKLVVSSDKFLDLPATTKVLYFYLNLEADDDGFVGNTKAIMRFTASTDDDFKMLLAKQFVIPFENGVTVIRDWKVNNLLRKDRSKPTIYKEQKKKLMLRPDNSYVLIGEPGSENARKVISEVSEDENNSDSSNDSGDDHPEFLGRGQPNDNHLTDKRQPFDDQVTTNGQPDVNQPSAKWQPSDNQHGVNKNENADTPAFVGMTTKWQPNDNHLPTKCPHRVGEDRVVEDKLGTTSSTSSSLLLTAKKFENVVQKIQESMDYKLDDDDRGYMQLVWLDTLEASPEMLDCALTESKLAHKLGLKYMTAILKRFVHDGITTRADYERELVNHAKQAYESQHTVDGPDIPLFHIADE